MERGEIICPLAAGSRQGLFREKTRPKLQEWLRKSKAVLREGWSTHNQLLNPKKAWAGGLAVCCYSLITEMHRAENNQHILEH